ncbi:MAG: response regulator [Campylobacterota bacterium]|nr:response regulator [Campylobacterota bacterium]
MMDFESLGSVTILSVEDDGFNQELASAIFDEFSNIDVLQASNGKEALDLIESNTIDIILLDLMMPKMNGFETLEVIKNDDNYFDIPVIIVTSEENEQKRTYKLGANDFISKPYNPTELKLRVLNNLKIKKFCDLVADIGERVKSDDAGSTDHLCNLQKALKIADNSQKQLLAKLGSMAHENGHKDNDAPKRLGEYVALLSKLYGLGKREIDDLFYAMSIYDIGLLRIPKDGLSNIDSKAYKNHPKLGLMALDGLEETTLIKMAKLITLSHHEHWDGSGYPNGTQGEDISIFARITAVVDYYDELTVKRNYNNKTMSCEDALEVMKREKGIKLDPKLLDMFSENFSQFKEIKNRLT